MIVALVISLVVNIVLLCCALFFRWVAIERMKPMNRNRVYYELLIQWLEFYKTGHTIEDWLKNRGYHRIAIYGIGRIGERLYEEIKDSEIEIMYAIDRDVDYTPSGLEIRRPNEELDDIDAIVVSPIHIFDVIKNDLSSRVKIPIISISEIVLSMD